MKLAAQLYTVRNATLDVALLEKTLGRIRSIGFSAVQVSGIGPISYTIVKQMFDKIGLICCATHESGQLILDDPNTVVKLLQTIGSNATAFPHPGPIDLSISENVHSLANRLNASGKIIYDAGCRLTYHNHSVEFFRHGTTSALDMIYQSTDPRYLQAELDTYWVQAGGGNPVAWIKRLNGRIPLLHIKDYGVDSHGKPCMREIGRGNLDWDSILYTAEEAKVEWLIVEQDENWIDNDPFKALTVSFEFLSKRGL